MTPPPKNKTHCSGISPQDILGNLPENVLDDILMCLPLRDAVRTSILAKKWRYKWCRLPELTIDETLTKGDLQCLTSNFTKIVYQCILTLHVGPITKFTLDIPCLNDCPNIDNLICFLARNDIQYLVLRLPFQVGHNRYKLPSSFFTCLQLRNLTLQSCLLVPPLSFKGFNRLISLELHCVTISSKTLKSLIFHCPILERLLLHHIRCDVIQISAPMLRSFDFKGVIRSICLKNLPLLAKLSLEYVNYVGATGNCSIAKFFESFSALEHLYLDGYSLKSFAAGTSEVPTRLPFNLNRVKHLYLSRIYLGVFEVTSIAFCLIRSLPHLECLDIELAHHAIESPALECLELEAFSDVTFNLLKKVKLEIHGGTKPVMQLTKLLLAKSPVLLRMQVDVSLNSGKNKCLRKVIKISAMVNSFWRASPKAKVIYNVKKFESKSIFDESVLL